MWQAGQVDLLRAEIEMLLAPLAGTGDLIRAIQDTLIHAHLGGTTDHRSKPPWALLPVIVCDSVCGQGERAIPTSAAMLSFKAAADVFDDIEDADAPESISAKYGEAVATNVATALLFVAEIALTRLKAIGVPDTNIVRVMEKVNSYHLSACTGQHADIVFSGDITVTEDRYLKMIELKTASQLECSCCVGALLGNGDQDLVTAFSKLGRCLGMAAQIANDIRGITDGNDIVGRKVTLPVIYAFAHADDRSRGRLKSTYCEKEGFVANPEQTRELLFQTGAIQYAIIKTETFRQEALELLSEAETRGAAVRRLKAFLV